MSWTDIDDFLRQYDSSVNPDNYAKRNQLFGTYDLIGYLLKRGLLDADTLFAVSQFIMVGVWVKFKPIVEYYRRVSGGKDLYENWEYAARVMAEYKERVDPTWWYTTTNFSREDYEKAFRSK